MSLRPMTEKVRTPSTTIDTTQPVVAAEVLLQLTGPAPILCHEPIVKQSGLHPTN